MKIESETAADSTSHFGRPRKYPPVTKANVIRRKERKANFGSIIGEFDSAPRFASNLKPPTQTLCVTLSLPCLLLLDLYVEFVADRTKQLDRVHHGTVIDSLAIQLKSDSEFLIWMKKKLGNM